jgi:hypothetical protein
MLGAKAPSPKSLGFRCIQSGSSAKAVITPTVQELRKRLLSFCQKHPITKLEVFGSVADGTAKRGSDVDLMGTFRPGALRWARSFLI